MNLINMISCREHAWSLLLLLLTSESCGAWEIGGSFIVSLLPGARDRCSSCLVLPHFSRVACLSPRKQDISSHLPDPMAAARLSAASPKASEELCHRSTSMMLSQTNFLLHLTSFPTSTYQPARAADWAKLYGQTGSSWGQGAVLLKGAAGWWCFL